MNINNVYLPKLSTSLFWIIIIGYAFLFLLNFLTGFGQEYLLHATGGIVLLYLVLRNTHFVLKYGDSIDYIEYSSGHFFQLDEMSIKSNLIRIVKSDILEIELIGFFLWKKLRFKMEEDGNRYYVDIPLRFIATNKVNQIINDVVGDQASIIEASEIVVSKSERKPGFALS
jgi:hypothetical protein